MKSYLVNIEVYKKESEVLYDYILTHSNQEENEIRKWWKKANKIKNTGWYVTDSNGTLITPERITNEDYIEARKITLPLELSLVLLSKMREMELEKEP